LAEWLTSDVTTDPCLRTYAIFEKSNQSYMRGAHWRGLNSFFVVCNRTDAASTLSVRLRP